MSSDVPDQPLSKLDTSVPHSARIWNYWLGGKDNYAIDREVGEQMVKILPDTPKLARAYRHFLARAVHYLAGEVGIRQFLDIGTGLPTVDNTHEVAQRIAPESRIVYVDNDPLVLVHARVLLTSSPEGATDYIDADLREPEAILREAARTLDFAQPVALMLIGVLAHITDHEEARTIVRTLLQALPSGSHLVLIDGISGFSAETDAALQRYNESGAAPYNLRTKQEIDEFFDGLELVEPGLVFCTRWRPEATPFGPPEEVNGYGGIGRLA
jgi:O-methyltransferase involved in polyketide biosynthesis